MKATSPFWLASRKIVQSYRTRAETCWSATGNSERSTKTIGPDPKIRRASLCLVRIPSRREQYRNRTSNGRQSFDRSPDERTARHGFPDADRRQLCRRREGAAQSAGETDRRGAHSRDTGDLCGRRLPPWL